jgi:hypothetical protein
MRQPEILLAFRGVRWCNAPRENDSTIVCSSQRLVSVSLDPIHAMAICNNCGRKYSKLATPVSAKGVCGECFEAQLGAQAEGAETVSLSLGPDEAQRGVSGVASAAARAVKERSVMRRTLLPIGFAVLASMLVAPHGNYNKGHHSPVAGIGPFFMQNIPYWRAEYQLRRERVVHNPFDRFDAQAPEWATQPNGVETIPAGWDAYHIGPVMIDMLILQTLFLGVLFAVLVNLRKSWRRKPKQM